MSNAIYITALVLVVVLGTGLLLAQDSQPTATSETPAPLLTVNEAVALALSNNRLVKNSSLEAEKFDYQIHATATRRRPQFNVSVLGGMHLNPIEFRLQMARVIGVESEIDTLSSLIAAKGTGAGDFTRHS